MAVSSSKTYYRLGLIQNWRWPFFWFSLIFYALLTFLYDVVLTDNWSWLWLVTFSAGTALQLAIFAIAKITLLPKLLSTRAAGIFALILAGILTAARNTFIGYLGSQLGLIDQTSYFARLIGGFFLGAGILLFYVEVMGSRVQHDMVANRLQQIKKLLLLQKETAEKVLKEENQKLLEQTQKTLLPRIDEIKNLLISNHTKLDSINELRTLVQQQVRPLSAELSTKSRKLAMAAPTDFPQKVRFQLLSQKVWLQQSLSPLWASLATGLTYMAITNLLGSANVAEISLLTGVGYLILLLFKFLIPKHKTFNRAQSINLIAVIALASGAPYLLTIANRITDLHTVLLYSMVLLTPFLILLGMANAMVMDRARDEAERQMQNDTNELARETALFEQQMWLAKRSWTFVVHGTVQAALTAAITRLSSAEELEPYQLNLVLQDLDRARDALTKTPNIEVDLVAALNAVASTWDGLCKVTWTISERAKRALDRDVNARMCVNEIVKETVSNAVRHGEAREAKIEIDCIADSMLHISVRNNGRLVSGDLDHGVGTRMLDDLTLNWSLTNNRATRTVDFEANLPIALVAAASK
jgi:signal transduction histidine kinase